MTGRFGFDLWRAAVGVLALSAIGLCGREGLVAQEAGSHSGASQHSSMAYKGHENERDSHNMAHAYPAIIGTRIDDCRTCHRGGTVTYAGGKSTRLNPCSYCHLLPFPDERISSGAPDGFAATLNDFGLAYNTGGRDVAALMRIAREDADDDGFDNQTELAALRFPGDPTSTPAQPIALVRTFAWRDLTALPYHEQSVLLNNHRQQLDDYAHYGGVRLLDLIAAVGAPVEENTTVTCYAPDGFAIDVTYEQLTRPYPAGRFYPDLGPEDFASPEHGFVNYPPADQIPDGVSQAGDVIPGGPWVMIAYRRDGEPLHTSHLDAATGHLEGEGPYRLIVPQTSPGMPDRGMKFSPSGLDDGHDFDESKDHNAGLCARGLVAIRINPMPEGYEEFDWRRDGGFGLLEQRRLIVYGAGVTAE